MDDYALVSKSALKLKRDDSGIKKKKKKKSGDAQRALEMMAQNGASKSTTPASESASNEVRAAESSSGSGMTKAERSFLKKQEKRQMERILVKASKTHKQRVEEFNSHLDSLSEHYDIPKVSWTK